MTSNPEPRWLRDIAGGRAPEIGLYVARADPRPLARELGLEVTREAVDRWPEGTRGMYVVLSAYMRPFSESVGLSFSADSWVSRLLIEHPREVTLRALATLNHLGQDEWLIQRLKERQRRRFAPELARAFEMALAGTSETGPAHLVFRGAVLRAMRLVAQFSLEKPEEVAAAREQAGLPLDGFDPLDAALLLSHGVAEGLGAHSTKPTKGYPEDTPRLGGLPEPLALELVANGVFTRADNPGNLLGRTRLLYTQYGPRVARHPARRLALDLAEEALGMPLDDALLIGFAYYAGSLNQDPDTLAPGLGLPSQFADVSEESCRRFLDLFAQRDDELGARSATARGDWQMRAIQERPLLRVGDEVVVLDERYLLERITRGLYWLIHDHERDISQGDRQLWTQAHGEMHEMLVEDYLEAFAPPLLGAGGRAIFTEDDLGAAFPGKRADVGLDFGSSVFIADAQGGQISTRTREEASADAFKADLDRLVVQKAKQLDETAAHLLTDPQPAKSPLMRPAPRVFPAVLPAGQFPSSPVTTEYLRHEADRLGLLQDPRIEPLVVLDLRDLEHAQSVRERDGASLPDLLSGWRESEYSAFSLSDYLYWRDKDRGLTLERPGALQQAMNAAFEELLSRLNDGR